MHHDVLFGVAAIVILGIASQWIAWRIRLPAILLLLTTGVLAGPVTGFLNPDKLFGDLLFPVVSVSVALVLFEGGLTLRLKDIKATGRVVISLTTIGLLITWMFAVAGAHWLVGLPWELSVLVGGILVVSGPTVVVPLLRHIRPVGPVASVAKWEGIVNDPFGAILAVLVLNVVLAGADASGTGIVVTGVALSLVVGSLVGFAMAALLVLLLREHIIPDFLQSSMALMTAVMAYVAGDMVYSESGLLAVTVMGITLANQPFVSIRRIIEFKENLGVLLISSLFVVLAARLTIEEMALDDVFSWLLVVMLIVVARPIAVMVSAAGSSLNLRERAFLAWLAPRGIVAAAVVSVFALRMESAGIEGSEAMVPIVFKVIIGTVVVYGLTSPILARYLGIARPNPQGILFVGAHSICRELAQALQKRQIPTALIDTNWSNVRQAKKLGLRAFRGNVLSEDTHYELDLDGIGKLVAATPNDEINSMAAMHFAEVFDRSQVFQLSPSEQGRQRRSDVPKHMRGRYLFGDWANYEELDRMFGAGAVVKSTNLTEEFDWPAFRAMYGEQVLHVFTIRPSGRLRVTALDQKYNPTAGDTVVAVVYPLERVNDRQ